MAILEREKNDMNILHYGYYHRFNFHCIKNNAHQFFRNLKFAKQRITRGYADCDTWNMDTYWSKLLHDMMYYLADNCNGYPCRLETNDGTDRGAEVWEKELKEIGLGIPRPMSFGKALGINTLTLDQLTDEIISKYKPNN